MPVNRLPSLLELVPAEKEEFSEWSSRKYSHNLERSSTVPAIRQKAGNEPVTPLVLRALTGGVDHPPLSGSHARLPFDLIYRKRTTTNPQNNPIAWHTPSST
ncbi:hypothetical protein EVAR_68792_1 [Eumeta japonica]|uniref:Uncharacterized protein n=1 Tax=Eumeta variegata TaxID=151549 RepID=A0A4C1ZZ89_EUMVA|nr:hypothetical protein EVAR_68792_1 [Eumeta japonica]